MYKYTISKFYLLTRFYKLLIIFFLDLSILVSSSYLSLLIRLDEYNLFQVTDQAYLISIEYFLIPVVSYYFIAVIFKFYRISFRYFNLGQNTYYAFFLLGILILFLNIILNSFFSYGALIINIILICALIILSRKLISKIYFNFHGKFKDNSLIISDSENLHRIYEYLKLNQKILIKAILIEDIKKIDFTKYRDYKIENIKNLAKICKKQKIKNIYANKHYKIFEKKKFIKYSINIFDTNGLFRSDIKDTKQEFVDKYFDTSNKINNKDLKYYQNKTILITGAGGSIGKNLFIELLNYNTKKIILVDQDELKLFNLRKTYENFNLKSLKKLEVSFRLGNLSNEYFVKNIFFENKKIDCVLHAAAYKHVGFGEENILSFIKNNIFVTQNLAEISIKNKVKKFIFISTDKAVNPKSVMGYTKSICEKILIYLNDKYDLDNIFKIVRFGNVINSDGSVLPIFEKQILSNGPVTVTNKDATRYFMSIRNACQLVLHTIGINKRIGIFILNMGKPYKILNIAKSMIDFYLEKKKILTRPKIIFIGLHDGEKIHEELVLGKNLVKSKIKNILIANEKFQNPVEYSLVLRKLKNLYNKNYIKKILRFLRDNA